MKNSASTIRLIRKRLDLTMTEFADLIGTEQSTISRYESGHIEPSKTVWTLLFLLASDEERASILEYIGGVSDAVLASRFHGAEDKLKQFTAKHRTSDDLSRVVFAEESAEILAAGKKIDPALVELLKLFRKHPDHRKLNQAIAQMMPYFEFVASHVGSTSKPS